MHIQEQAELRDLMQSLEVVLEESVSATPAGRVFTPQCSLWRWLVGAMLVLLIGSWFVWLSAYVQWRFADEDIRTACQRVMPDTVQRCVDTVVIQRGGARR